jgi:CheY-like chemotaxis protein
VMMPDVDGRQVLEGLQRAGSTAPIVFLTALDVASELGRLPGVVAVLPKTFDPMTFAAELEKVMEAHRKD